MAEPALVTHEQFVESYRPADARLKLVAHRRLPAGRQWIPALGTALQQLAEMADFLLRLDVTTVENKPDDAEQRTRCSAQIGERADCLRQLVDMRPSVLRAAPKVRAVWPDSLDRHMREIVARSDAGVKRMSGPIGLKPLFERADDVINAVDRYLPMLVDGTYRETPAEVMEFCVRENIAGYLHTAVHTARRAFPGATNLRLGVETDPDGDEQWVSIGLDIPDVDTVVRFLAYETMMMDAMPADTANKFRLFYNVL